MGPIFLGKQVVPVKLMAALGQFHIKQCQPILKGLQSKAAKDESDAEHSKPALGKVVSIIFDVGIDRCPNAGDDSCHQSHADRKRPRVIHVMNERATDQGRDNVADGTDDRSPKLATCKAWAQRRRIVHGGTHPASVSEYLSDRDKNGKCGCKFETQSPV